MKRRKMIAPTGEGETAMRTIIIAAVVLAASGTLAAAKEIDLDSPKIQINGKDHDFGNISQYTQHVHVFSFTNAGTAPLKISSVHASCGCTGTLLSADTIEPGKAGELKVTFNSGTFRGNVRKTITLKTNDPGNETVTLTIAANIIADLMVAPQHVQFGRINVGDSPELTARISSPSGKVFTVVSAVSSLNFVKAEVDKPDVAAQEHEIRIKVDGTPPGGGFQGSIDMKTSLDTKASLSVVFSGYVRERTSVIPPKLFFGIVRPGEHPTRSIIIEATSWEGLKVEKVTAPAGFTAAANQEEAGKRWRIDVSVGDGIEGGTFNAGLQLLLNDEQMPQCEVKMTGLMVGKKARE